jgi:WD40 repeat protein
MTTSIRLLRALGVGVIIGIGARAAGNADEVVAQEDAARSGPEDVEAKVLREAVLTLREHELGVNGVAYRPDGKRIASAGQDTLIKFWEMVTSKPLLSLNGSRTDMGLLIRGRRLPIQPWPSAPPASRSLRGMRTGR